MRHVLKLMMYMVVLGGVALLGFAVFSDLPAPQRDIEIPIATQ
jgi:hypothetical protein